MPTIMYNPSVANKNINLRMQIIMQKKVSVALLLTLIFTLLTLAGCGTGSGDGIAPILLPDRDVDTITIDGVQLTRVADLPYIWDVPEPPPFPYEAAEVKTTELLQLTPLYMGELITIIHTSMGDIAIRFFPTEAPIAVENFLRLAWSGYYDGITFHRIMYDFMIQGGCPLGTGTGGQSYWGGQFGQEISPQLRHFRGALAMAQTAQPMSIGSQFYIVQNRNLNSNSRSQYINLLERQDEIMWEFGDGSTATVGEVFTPESLHHFMNYGGTPWLDWHGTDNPHTIFGHVVWGMDVVDTIAETELSDDRYVITMEGFSFFTVTGGV